MGVSKAFQVFYGAANIPVGHTISLDYDTTLPGKSRITHPISPCIAVAGGAAPSRGGYPVTVRARPAG